MPAVIPFRGSRLKSEGDPYAKELRERRYDQTLEQETQDVWPLKVEFVTRVHDLCEALCKEMGGQLSVQEELMVRNIATYQAQLEQYTEVWLYKIGTPDAIDKYERSSAFLSTAMEKLRTLRSRHPLSIDPMAVHKANGHDPKSPRP